MKMLHKVSELEGYALRARDGDVGHVHDFYFDDRHWHIRYFVIDTGSWLTGRKVLISPEAVSGQLWADKVIPVNLTRAQIESSPSLDTAKPVERQHELELRHHYGWPPYWGVMFPEAAVFTGRSGASPERLGDGTSPAGRSFEDGPVKGSSEEEGDPHLHSTGEVTQYHIEASDGAIGHVADFLIDTDAWRVRYLIVDTRNWWPGKKVLISPAWIRDVKWSDSTVCVDLPRTAVKGSPPYDPAQPLTAESAGQLHDHYGRPRYPDWDPDHKSPESRRNFQS